MVVFFDVILLWFRVIFEFWLIFFSILLFFLELLFIFGLKLKWVFCLDCLFEIRDLFERWDFFRLCLVFWRDFLRLMLLWEFFLEGVFEIGLCLVLFWDDVFCWLGIFFFVLDNKFLLREDILFLFFFDIRFLFRVDSWLGFRVDNWFLFRVDIWFLFRFDNWFLFCFEIFLLFWNWLILFFVFLSCKFFLEDFILDLFWDVFLDFKDFWDWVIFLENGSLLFFKVLFLFDLFGFVNLDSLDIIFFDLLWKLDLEREDFRLYFFIFFFDCEFVVDSSRVFLDFFLDSS